MYFKTSYVKSGVLGKRTSTRNRYARCVLPDPLENPVDEEVPSLRSLDRGLLEVERVVPHQVKPVEGVKPQRERQQHQHSLARARFLSCDVANLPIM